MIGSIFLVEPDWLLGIWLGDVPPYASVFLVLFVIDQLVQSFNSGISNIIWASGKIALYQVLTSSLNIMAILAGYFVLKGGTEAYYLAITYICFSVIRFFAIQWSLHYTLRYENHKLWKNSYLPSILVVLMFLPVLLIPHTIHPLIRLIVSFSYLCFLEYHLGLSVSERKKLAVFLYEKFARC